MKDKSLEQCLRDFYFSLSETIAHINDCEKLCPTGTLIEMSETLLGIMAEQTEIIAAIEGMKFENDWYEIRKAFRRPLAGERFYSSHLDALCDLMRLAKHLKDLADSKNELLETMKRLESFSELPPLDIKLIRSTLDAIPSVKALRSDE